MQFAAKKQLNRCAGRQRKPVCTFQHLLMLKLTAAFMFLTVLQLSARSYGQQVSLKVKDVPLEQALQAISRQAGMALVYRDGLMQSARSVTISVHDVPLKTVLDIIFKGRPLDWEIIGGNILSVKEKVVQVVTDIPVPPPIDIHGRVVNEKGEPVAGATITVKGTRNATATDENGEFVLNGVDENAVLVVSGVNIESFEVKVAGSTELGILKSKIKISESEEVVVNTGYEYISKERSAGSYVIADIKTINKLTGISILERLEGTVSGVLFNHTAGPPITIRGISSIMGPKQPLVIIDNFPYDGDMSNINPNDIENISILKDAVASSIWGARAGNGVIVITSKKGVFNQKLKTNISLNNTIRQKPDIFKSRRFISSSEFLQLEKELFDNEYYNTLENSNAKPAVSPFVEDLIANRDGKITNDELNSRMFLYGTYDVRDDIDKLLYSNEYLQQYAISLSGGGSKNTYYFSAGYDENKNYLSAISDRFSMKTSNSFTPVDRLVLSAAIGFTTSNNHSGKEDIDQIFSALFYPYSRFSDDTGQPLRIIKDNRQTYIDTAGGGRLLSWDYYPLEEYKSVATKKSLQDILINTGLQYHLAKWLNAEFKYTFEKQMSNTRRLADTGSYFTRRNINSFSQISSTGVVTYNMPLGGILRLSNSQMRSDNFRGQLNINHKKNNYSINGIIGFETKQTVSTSDENTIYGYNDKTLTLANVNYVSPFKSYITGGNQYIPNNSNFSSKLYRFVSYYGNGAFVYGGKYMFNASVRKDQSNIFGVKSNQKGIPLWSVGFVWNISKEPIEIPFNLKLRGTYGFNGNVDPSVSAVATIYYSNNDFITNLLNASISQFPNPSLRWEKNKIINFGIDIRTIDNVISGSIEYYTKKGTDLLGMDPIDYTAGLRVTSVLKNVASMKGHGIDLSLNTINFNGQLKWRSSFFLNYNRNKVTRYYPALKSGSSYINDGFIVRPLKGYPVYSLISYAWEGLNPENGNPKGVINGVTSEDYAAIVSSGTAIQDLVFSGPSIPVYSGALLNDFSYKGLELSINLIYKADYYFRKPSVKYAEIFSRGWGDIDYYRRWRSPGDELKTTVPSIVFTNTSARDNFYSNSEVTVVKGDQIRCQFVNLGYTFSSKSTKVIGLNALVLYFKVANVGIIWRANNEKIDPDYPNSIPPKKVFTFGINANF